METFIVLDTKNMTMYEKPLDEFTEDVFSFIAGIAAENEHFMIYTTIMTLEKQENYKFLYGNPDDFKRRFPDWKEFFLKQSNKSVFYSKNGDLGGYIVRKI